MDNEVKTIEELSRERVQQIINEFCDGSRMEFCRRTGIGKSSVSQYMSGTNAPGTITAQKIGEAFHLNPMWIMGFDAPMRYSEPIDFEEYKLHKPTLRTLPVLGRVACGEPIITNEEREFITLEDVPGNASMIFIAQGDSMINARIMDGDYVFVHEQPQVENGEIAIVIIGDEATLKRVYFDQASQTMTLVAENPAYAPMVYSGDSLSDIKILGKAVAFQSTVK